MSGRKAELVERIKANATYQADVAALANMGINKEQQKSRIGTKRSLSYNVRNNTLTYDNVETLSGNGLYTVCCSIQTATKSRKIKRKTMLQSMQCSSGS